MKVNKESMRLYAVTDSTWLKGNSLACEVEKAILGGATFIQLREKELGFDEFTKLAKEVKNITDKYKIPFVINDNIDVALEVDADGVHIGQDDGKIEEARKKLGPNKVIGLSTHNVNEALKAQEYGADYIGIGAVFSTSTKLDASSVTFDILKEICDTVSIPTVAIGGISKKNILHLKGSGVDGVAVISAIFAEKDIEEASRELLKLSCEMTKA